MVTGRDTDISGQYSSDRVAETAAAAKTLSTVPPTLSSGPQHVANGVGECVDYVPGSALAASISLGGLGRFLIDGLSVSDYAQMAGGAVLVALLALLVDGILSLVQRTVVSPGLTGRFGKQRDNRPVVSTTARGDALDPASPTDRADDQREALV
jgi:hypothetical protein